MNRKLHQFVALATCLAVHAPAAAQENDGSEWTHYASGTNGHKYSPLDQIDAGNVSRLQVAWRSPSPDLAFQDDPILRRSRNDYTTLMANGVLYTITGLGIISALDPGTGETLWMHDPRSYEIGRPNNGGFLQRGMEHWTDGDDERLLAYSMRFLKQVLFGETTIPVRRDARKRRMEKRGEIWTARREEAAARHREDQERRRYGDRGAAPGHGSR